MLDTVFSDISNLSNATLFWFQHDLSLKQPIYGLIADVVWKSFVWLSKIRRKKQSYLDWSYGKTSLRFLEFHCLLKQGYFLQACFRWDIEEGTLSCDTFRVFRCKEDTMFNSWASTHCTPATARSKSQYTRQLHTFRWCHSHSVVQHRTDMHHLTLTS